MKILIVSSHYPPNFVSGGSLIPEQLAGGLAARGHEVIVFAGEQTPDRPAYSTRRETTADGVTVSWVTLDRSVHWDSDENFINTRITALFARYLAEEKPDVVHFHSIQGFGAGIVSSAKAAGCPTVVTMHDMWWWCGRQFLADREGVPCSPVVECGECACELTPQWRQQRNDLLWHHLRNADRVLAPSPAMVPLLRANGVTEEQIRVNENNVGRDLSEIDAHRSAADEPVRFAFAGGRHTLKGGDLLMRAARQLPDDGSWQLDVYGYEPPSSAPKAVRAQPPYRSDDAVRTLSRYDVCVLPSVMIETFSILTREALLAGCAVIATDSPGPAEIIRDGENGLLVRRGSPDAIANAMRRVIEDRQLLARLRAGRLDSSHLVSLDAQVAEAEQYYQELVAEPRTEEFAPTIQRVLLVSGIEDAPLRYRGYLPQEALAAFGVTMDIEMYRSERIPKLARQADAIVLYRVPATYEIFDVIEAVRASGRRVPILYDIDDLVFEPELASELNPVLKLLPEVNLDLYWQGVRRYRATLEACDGYIGSTQTLCDHARAVTGMPSYRFANGVGELLARVSDLEVRRPRKPGPLRIGYFSGTATHNEDWAFIEDAVVEVMRERPDVELWLGGLLQPSSRIDEVADRVVRLPKLPWYELPGVLRDLDVNLAPLRLSRFFNEAKSSIKYLEAALVKTPTIASPTQPFRESIDHGVNGFLAGGPDEWKESILALLDSAELRAEVGETAYGIELLRLSPKLQGERYLRILSEAAERVAREGHKAYPDDWQPELVNESWTHWVPEPYFVPHITPPPRRELKRIARDYVVSARRFHSEKGTKAVVRKAAQVVRGLPARVRGRL